MQFRFSFTSLAFKQSDLYPLTITSFLERGKGIFRRVKEFPSRFIFIPPYSDIVHVFLSLHMHPKMANPVSLFPFLLNNITLSKNCCVQKQCSRTLPTYCFLLLLFFSFSTQLCKHCSVHSACSFKAEKQLSTEGGA